MGISGIVAVPLDLKSTKELLEISEDSDFLFPTAGIHPHNAVDSTRNDIDDILEILDRDDVIAAAEIGVDLHFLDKKSKDEQLEVFRRVMNGAVKRNLPIILHCPRGEPICFKEVEKAGADRVVFHWYTGPQEILEKIMRKENYYISITPAIFYSGKLQKIAKIADLSDILVESDGPTEYRNLGRGRPSQIPQVIEKIADIKEMKENKVEKITDSNAKEFFVFSKS